MQYAKDLHEALFIQMILGDDRAIAATYVAGNKVYDRSSGIDVPADSFAHVG